MDLKFEVHYFYRVYFARLLFILSMAGNVNFLYLSLAKASLRIDHLGSNFRNTMIVDTCLSSTHKGPVISSVAKIKPWLRFVMALTTYWPG